MATLESIRPYVDQLFDDSEVQEQLRRAGRNLRVARSRAGSAKSKKKAVQDEQLRRRLVAATRNLAVAYQVLAEAPVQQKRKRRRGRVLLLITLAAGGAVAANADARAWVQQQLGGGSGTGAA